MTYGLQLRNTMPPPFPRSATGHINWILVRQLIEDSLSGWWGVEVNEAIASTIRLQRAGVQTFDALLSRIERPDPDPDVLRLFGLFTVPEAVRVVHWRLTSLDADERLAVLFEDDFRKAQHSVYPHFWLTFRDRDRRVQLATLYAMATSTHIDPAYRQQVFARVALDERNDEMVRAQATFMLRTLPGSKAIVNALVNLLEDESGSVSPYLRYRIIGTLGVLGDIAAIETLEKYIDDDTQFDDYGRIGTEAEHAIEVIRERFS